MKGNRASSLRFVVKCPKVFAWTEESLERTMRERGSAMQAQTKSVEICKNVSALSLMAREGEAAWVPLPLGDNGNGAGICWVGSSATAVSSVRPLVTLKSDIAIVATSGRAADGTAQSWTPQQIESEVK